MKNRNVTLDKSYKTETVPIEFTHNGILYHGLAHPITGSCSEGVCYELDVTLNSENLGTISCGQNLEWTMRTVADKELIRKIGEEILLWYE